MALILNIETATNVCSVAVASDGKILSVIVNNEGQSHARVLTTMIAYSLKESKIALHDLDAIAVSKGPGSFTGLRIGVAAAKGLCYALDKPLISVNTLQSMAAYFQFNNPTLSNLLLCPMIDARRMEVYTAVFFPDLTFKEETSAKIIDQNSFSDIINNQPVAFFGDGSGKAAELLGNENLASFFSDFAASAAGMVPFSEKSYNMNEFESIAYFEPFYLKDFYSPGQPS